MSMDMMAIGASRKYVGDTLNGLGALAGKPCAIQSITSVSGGNNVIFAWTGDDGTTQTKTMFVANGTSPTLSSYVSDEGVTILRIEDENSVEEIPISGGNVDVLSGKRILCIGDSICEGVGANGQPYAHWLQQWHPAAKVINLGVGGMTVARRDSSITNAMPVRIASGEFETDDYADIDIVVLEGGINDLMNNVKLGYITKGYSATKYTTFCQGMEYMFSYFKNLYPKARMIFISTHNVSAYDYNKSQAWWGAASEICSKWGVEFLDLFSLVCTPKISGLQLHPDYAVHRDYYAKYLNMALTANTPLAGARTTNYYKHNVPCMLAYYSGTKSFGVGDIVSTSDWRINMIRADLTTYVNVSSSAVYDITEVDNTVAGVYPVHVAYSEGGITVSTDVNITIVGADETTKSLDSISATKVTTEYTVGSDVNTDDITVIASYTDGSTAVITENLVIDTSNINASVSGEYNISVQYSEDSIVKTTQIQVSIIENQTNGGDGSESDNDAGGGTDTTTWDDSTTITAAWRTTEGMFSNIEHARGYTEGTVYNVSCKLMVESESATSGEVILRVDGVQKSLGTINFGEVIEVDTQMTANAAWTANGNSVINVYTTSGTRFPWNVYIKDFTIV